MSNYLPRSLYKRKLSFLNTPSTISPGSTYSITWSGSTASTVTLDLLQSSGDNLSIVSALGGTSFPPYIGCATHAVQ
jgi:hypothetical protein